MQEKILIIEDEKDLCESIKSWLLERGYSCFFAYDGGEALSIAEKERPNLILLDLMIPGIDGFEVCHRIKHNERLKNIPIIITTVLGERQYRIAGFKAGADDYIIKPFDPDELILRIEANLRQARTSFELKETINALKEQERIKIESLSNIAHDLSIPINTIIDRVNSILADKEISRSYKDELEEILKTSTKLLSTVNMLADIAKAEAGKLWAKIDEFPLSEILHLVSLRHKQDAEKKGLSFSVTYPEIRMKTEKAYLIKILNELLSNAIKFTEKGSVSLEVEKDEENKCVIFNISDTGPGLSKEEMDIFSGGLYFQKRMGLILVKRLVSFLRGDIFVSSSTNGTRFKVVLPERIDAPARRKEDKR